MNSSIVDLLLELKSQISIVEESVQKSRAEIIQSLKLLKLENEELATIVFQNVIESYLFPRLFQRY